jgi:DNA gyrase subunit A
MYRSRPDLSQVDPELREYIETLEAEIERLQARPSRRPSAAVEEEEVEPGETLFEPSEPPTTINVITVTASGIAKRTPRHLYSRQKRGGMGVFDLETPGDEPPAILCTADESETLLVMTDQARAFRLPVSVIPEKEVRARGESILSKLSLQDGEKLAAILPDQAEGYVALISQRGSLRLLRHHVFGEYMKPGTSLYDYRAFGPLASACWAPTDGDLLIATRQGKAIRFSFPEKQLPPQGGLGIRLSDDDQAVAICAVYEDSGVFLLGADGKGTIRLMEGFSANKAPGAGGKIAMNTDQLVGAATVEDDEDIFIISELSKMIRFQASDVPAKEGVVQGVICMSLRADRTAALAVSSRMRLV